MSNYYNRQWRLPNAWNGTESNVNKQSNYSMNFDGSNYIDTNFTISGISSYSFSLWFKAEGNITSGNKFLLGDMNSSGQVISTRATIGFRLVGSSSSGSYFFYASIGNGTDYWLMFESGYNARPLWDGSWHHLVLTVNSYTQKLYIDSSLVHTYDTSNTSGTLAGSSAVSAGTAGTQTFKIGTGGDFSGSRWNGQIDAVSIYNYELSASQITTLYGSSSTGIGNPMSLPAPVAYYPLGDQDSYNGSSYLTPNASLKDYVFDFNGSSQYIDISSSNSYGFGTGDFTISMWLYRETSSYSFPYIMDFRESTSAYNQNRLAIYYEEANGKLRCYINGNDVLDGSTGSALPLNSWFHLVLVRDSGTLSFYVDAVVDQTTSNSDDLLSTNQVNLGRRYDADRYFNGEISNAQIFNTALPATGSNSIETIYNNGSPLTSMTGFTSLVGWWKLDASDTYDGTNWTIEDHAGSNDGTSSGMTQANLIQSDLSFTSGYSPYALDFDGVNDYIQTTFNPYTSIGDNTSWTVSSWVYVSNVTTQQRILGTYSTLNAKRFWIGIINSGIAVGYGNRSFNPISGTSVSANSWQNIIVTYSTTTGYILVYVNGSLNGSKNYLNPQDGYANGDEIMANANISIGDSVGDSNFLNGSISNCSVWNAALTSAQVTEIYNEGVPSNLNNHSAYSNLVSWWQLGSNSSFNTNWTVLDEKGSNNGTSVNMTEADIVDGVGSYANGLSSGMGGDEIVGNAFGSSANSLSINMDVSDRTEDTPS